MHSAGSTVALAGSSEEVHEVEGEGMWSGRCRLKVDVIGHQYACQDLLWCERCI